MGTSLPPSKPLLQHSGRPAALLSGKLITRPPMQQAAILCALPLGSASRNGSHRQQQRNQAASTEDPQGGAGPGPWGQCGAVCSFAVSQQWEQWEAPQCVGAGNSHSGRASLGTLCAIVLGLVFTLYSMHLPEKLQK